MDTGVIELYERHAHDFDRDRSRSLFERAWLDRFVRCLPRGGTVLDIGCGMAEPIARYVIERGFSVLGVDSSPSMIAMCRERFPGCEWIVSDMRQLTLGRRFDGILAWDSFFHLHIHDQRRMFQRFATHAKPGAPLMFTSGFSEGERIGSYCGAPLYHASLDTSEYEHRLADNGFAVRAYKREDPACGEHTVWLATFEPAGPQPT